MSELNGWITTDVGARLSGYSVAYIRLLARVGRIEARHVGRDWLVNRKSLLAHVEEMKRLGLAKHNPWRADLAEDERGRRR